MGRSLAQLVSDAHPARAARVGRPARPRPHRRPAAQAAARGRARPARRWKAGRARRRPGRHGGRAHRRAHAPGAEVPDGADGPHRGHHGGEGPADHRGVARGPRRPWVAGQRHGRSGRLAGEPPDPHDLRRRPLPAGRQVRPSGSRAAAGRGGRGPAGPAPPRDGGGHASRARGTLQAPVLTAQARSAKLAAGETPLGKAELTLDYREAQTRLTVRARVAERRHARARRLGGASTSPIRRSAAGSSASARPSRHTAVARKFDLAFLTGFTTALREVGGTLEIDARASGTVGKPQGQGKLEWKDGVVGLAGFGEYQRVHLLAEREQRPHRARRPRGPHRVRLAEAHRARDAGTALSGRSRRTARRPTSPSSPTTSWWPPLSLRTDLRRHGPRGERRARAGPHPRGARRAARRRRGVTSRPSPGRTTSSCSGTASRWTPSAREAVLAQDRGGRGRRWAGAAPLRGGDKPFARSCWCSTRPKNLWLKSQDLNLEVGLGQDFRVEIGEPTDLFGEVRVLRGRLDVLGRRFDIQRNSVVRFTGHPTEPALDVTAVYTNVKAGVKVSMHVQGQGKNISLVPTSEPPLSESEIYTLLATGRTSLKRGSGGSEIGSAAGGVGAGLAGRLPAEGRGEQQGGPGRALGRGRRQGERSRARPSRPASTSPTSCTWATRARSAPTPRGTRTPTPFRLEYQFLPRWSLEAVYGDAKSGSADIVWSGTTEHPRVFLASYPGYIPPLDP